MMSFSNKNFLFPVMKRISILAFLLQFSFSIFGQTETESKKIEEEILSVTEAYNKTWGTLNMEEVAKFHSDSSFRYYRNMRLGVSSNEDFKKLMPKYFTGSKSWKIEVTNPVVQVLGPDAAVIGFTGKAEMVSIDGNVSDAGTGAYTYVWKKINGHWKIVHIHESAK
jgi:hypothetical protein